MRTRHLLAAGLSLAALAAASFAPAPAVASSIEQKDPTVHSVDINRATKSNARPKASPQLTYHGGKISTAPRVFLVYWGSQWGGVAGTDGSGIVTFNNDPKNVAPYQQSFFRGLGGADDGWSTSTTQYCNSGNGVTVPTGSSTCPAGAPLVTKPASSPLVAVWADAGAAAPAHPTQSQLAAEAVRAVTSASSGFSAAGFNPATDQVVVNTATGNSASGFGTQYCAWHSSTSSSVGTIAYTNMPYMPDALGSCGANFVSGRADGILQGVSIVGGHEYAETITDMFPNGGWLDSQGGENGDKCAWVATTGPVALDTGSFVVQPLWSNRTSNCVLSS